MRRSIGLRLAFPLYSLPCSSVSRAHIPALACLVLTAVTAVAEPLSKRTEINFFRDVPSRNLKGLATRSDGRLVAGPTLGDIAVEPPAALLWCLEPTDDPAHWLIGTGPEGMIIEVMFNPATRCRNSINNLHTSLNMGRGITSTNNVRRTCVHYTKQEASLRTKLSESEHQMASNYPRATRACQLRGRPSY